jgi:hypothetical protein
MNMRNGVGPLVPQRLDQYPDEEISMVEEVCQRNWKSPASLGPMDGSTLDTSTSGWFQTQKWQV